MSFDPHGYQEQPQDSSGPPGSPLASRSGQSSGPGGSIDPLEALRRKAREKVMMPAIFLIIVGLFNLLWVGYLTLNSLYLASLTDERFEKQAEQNPMLKKQMEELAKEGYALSDVKRLGMSFSGGTACAGLLVTMFTVFGAIRMIQLRNYGLAIFTSILSAVPCLSSLACCGVGEIVAIWSIIVLLNAEVREAFH